SRDKKLSKKLEKMDSYCSQWTDDLVKSKHDATWRNKFDDIYRLALEGLFCYKQNIKVLFDKLWSEDFKANLDKKNI
ncbi:unnamed protein product, partial [marine sediment metagenome]